MKIKNIWIEAENGPAIHDGEKYTNDNADVIVTFENDIRYVATFYTYENIEFLRQKNKESGECNNGKHFFGSDMILIDRLDRKSIEETIHYLIDHDEFQFIFREIEKDDE